MRVEAKNAWSVSSLIGTNALKDSCSIMKSMRGNMGCCVLPGHQLPVHPYPVCSVKKLRLHHDALTTLQDASTGARSTPTSYLEPRQEVPGAHGGSIASYSVPWASWLANGFRLCLNCFETSQLWGL